MYEFFGCDYCIFLYYKRVMSCRGYVYPVFKLVKKVLCLFTLYICSVYLVIKSYKLLIDCCMYKVTYIRLLNLFKIFDAYLHYPSKKVTFIQLLKLCGVNLHYISCRIYRKCNLTVVKAVLTL